MVCEAFSHACRQCGQANADVVRLATANPRQEFPERDVRHSKGERQSRHLLITDAPLPARWASHSQPGESYTVTQTDFICSSFCCSRSWQKRQNCLYVNSPKFLYPNMLKTINYCCSVLAYIALGKAAAGIPSIGRLLMTARMTVGFPVALFCGDGVQSCWRTCMHFTTRPLTSVCVMSVGTSSTSSRSTCAWVFPTTAGSSHTSTTTTRWRSTCQLASLRWHWHFISYWHFCVTLYDAVWCLWDSYVTPCVMSHGVYCMVQLCDTYPRYIYIPATAPTPVVLSSARFRSRGRLPVLSYLHRENQVRLLKLLWNLGSVGFTVVGFARVASVIIHKQWKTSEGVVWTVHILWSE